MPLPAASQEGRALWLIARYKGTRRATARDTQLTRSRRVAVTGTPGWRMLAITLPQAPTSL